MDDSLGGYDSDELVDLPPRRTARDRLDSIQQRKIGQRGSELMQYIDDLYAAGAKLWTKDMFLEIEEELAKAPQPASVKIRSMNGNSINRSVPFPPRNRSLHDSKEWTHTIGFEIYQYMRFNAGDLEDDCEEDLKAVQAKYTCAVNLFYTDIISSTVEYPELKAAWDESQRNWTQSAACDQLADALRKDINIPKTIKRMVCFALGDLERAWEYDTIPAADGLPLRRSMTQHAAALTLATLFGELIGTEPLPVLVQDPAYTPESKQVLTEVGFEVVGGLGALGFTHVDDDTVVMSCSPDVPVKQVVADIARPAVLIWNKVRPLSEESSEWTISNGRGEDSLCVPWTTDQDSPRTRELVEGYDMHEFPPSNQRFGDIVIYVRKD